MIKLSSYNKQYLSKFRDMFEIQYKKNILPSHTGLILLLKSG
jgi:hypothetical protein